jgi:hypothetical protein
MITDTDTNTILMQKQRHDMTLKTSLISQLKFRDKFHLHVAYSLP